MPDLEPDDRAGEDLGVHGSSAAAILQQRESVPCERGADAAKISALAG
jgi:hypothetical protein